MKAWSKQPPRQPDDSRERYLGKIAPYLDAAQELEALSSIQKRQVRRRIMRTVFANKQLHVRTRVAPALAAVGLLVAGGAAFATAESLGLIPRVDRLYVDAGGGDGSGQQARKRKALHSRSAGVTAAQPPVADAASVANLPRIPDPLLDPLPAQAVPWASSSPDSPAVGAVSAVPARVTSTRTSVKRPARAFAAFEPGRASTASAPAALPPAPVGVWPVPESLPAAVAPSLPVPGAGSLPFAAPAVPSPPAVIPAQQPPRPTIPAEAPAASPPPTDSALFGQAMRRLRVDGDPSRALSALQEHARLYPRSPLAGERTALEIEALLCLHRDRQALVLLDGLALDELPRSGERFVVRGELRAAQRRWQDASADFDQALTRTSGAPAWHERALWGRAVARLRMGEREAGMADVERYLDRYSKGRFAAEAARLSAGSSSSKR
jgi:hypothetical protein